MLRIHLEHHRSLVKLWHWLASSCNFSSAIPYIFSSCNSVDVAIVIIVVVIFDEIFGEKIASMLKTNGKMRQNRIHQITHPYFKHHSTQNKYSKFYAANIGLYQRDRFNHRSLLFFIMLLVPYVVHLLFQLHRQFNDTTNLKGFTVFIHSDYTIFIRCIWILFQRFSQFSEVIHKPYLIHLIVFKANIKTTNRITDTP